MIMKRCCLWSSFIFIICTVGRNLRPASQQPRADQAVRHSTGGRRDVTGAAQGSGSGTLYTPALPLPLPAASQHRDHSHYNYSYNYNSTTACGDTVAINHTRSPHHCPPLPQEPGDRRHGVHGGPVQHPGGEHPDLQAGEDPAGLLRGLHQPAALPRHLPAHHGHDGHGDLPGVDQRRGDLHR